MCVKPVPLPYKHWLESIVNAVVPDVYIIIEFAVALYIPLVPSLNKIEGLVVDEYDGKYEEVVMFNWVELSLLKFIIILYLDNIILIKIIYYNTLKINLIFRKYCHIIKCVFPNK